VRTSDKMLLPPKVGALVGGGVWDGVCQVEARRRKPLVIRALLVREMFRNKFVVMS
jgi:hypothetical protein